VLVFFRLLIPFIGLAIVGCATQLPTKPVVDASVHALHLKQISHIQTFHIQGRLAVNADGKGYSGSIAWVHQADADVIDVYTPLGSKIAHIHKTKTLVTLSNAKGESVSAQDTESLTEKTLGWRLPLNGLSDWAVGRPTQAPITQQQWDSEGKLTLLEQQGWKIEYPQYAESLGVSLPQKITLRNQNILLKLVIEQWATVP
jgi:outer membrane lipoprotein LolB